MNGLLGEIIAVVFGGLLLSKLNKPAAPLTATPQQQQQQPKSSGGSGGGLGGGGSTGGGSSHGGTVPGESLLTDGSEAAFNLIGNHSRPSDFSGSNDPITAPDLLGNGIVGVLPPAGMDPTNNSDALAFLETGLPTADSVSLASPDGLDASLSDPSGFNDSIQFDPSSFAPADSGGDNVDAGYIDEFSYDF